MQSSHVLKVVRNRPPRQARGHHRSGRSCRAVREGPVAARRAVVDDDRRDRARNARAREAAARPGPLSPHGRVLIARSQGTIMTTNGRTPGCRRRRASGLRQRIASAALLLAASACCSRRRSRCGRARRPILSWSRSSRSAHRCRSGSLGVPVVASARHVREPSDARPGTARRAAEEQPGRAAGGDDRDHAEPRAEQGERGGGEDRERGDVEPARRRRGLPPARPEHVPREERGEVHDDADHRGGDRGQRRGEAHLAVRRLDERPAGEDEQERRQEGEERRDDRAGMPASEQRTPGPAAPCVQPPTKPTNATTMMSGPGVVSPSARPSIICAGRQPAVALHRALIDVGQHRVGAAERQQRGLGEEPAHLRQRRRAAERAASAPSATPQSVAKHDRARAASRVRTRTARARASACRRR